MRNFNVRLYHRGNVDPQTGGLVLLEEYDTETLNEASAKFFAGLTYEGTVPWEDVVVEVQAS